MLVVASFVAFCLTGFFAGALGELVGNKCADGASNMGCRQLGRGELGLWAELHVGDIRCSTLRGRVGVVGGCPAWTRMTAHADSCSDEGSSELGAPLCREMEGKAELERGGDGERRVIGGEALAEHIKGAFRECM
ncbi:hypothetical protein B0H17DRAFT_1141958 [Mycena rosella]|uniref:Secreted protein n=1 Tax=Mycena rosella TaxID=1033263 RepID=A0AAD7G8H6_MYCRO|nr:hypothetical protein B0H17DRAFT_1141958 [Mycena rosella]